MEVSYAPGGSTLLILLFSFNLALSTTNLYSNIFTAVYSSLYKCSFLPMFTMNHYIPRYTILSPCFDNGLTVQLLFGLVVRCAPGWRRRLVAATLNWSGPLFTGDSHKLLAQNLHCFITNCNIESYRYMNLINTLSLYKFSKSNVFFT